MLGVAALTITIGADRERHDLANAERPIAVRIAHAVNLVLEHDHQRVGEWRELHQVLDARRPVRPVHLALGRVQAERLRDQLRVAVRGEADAPLQHVLAQALAVDQLAVVRHRERTVRRVHHERLAVDLLRRGRGRVARVPDAEVALQLLHRVVGEDVVDHAHALVHVEVLRAVALARHDAGRLLAAVLQRHQPETDDLRHVNLRRPFARRNRAEHAALVRQPARYRAPARPLLPERQRQGELVQGGGRRFEPLVRLLGLCPRLVLTIHCAAARKERREKK